MKKDDNSLLAFAISLAGHLVVILLFIFGLPSMWKKFPEEQVIAFEMLPVSDVSNIKTQKVQKEKEVESEEAKKVQQSKPVEKPKEEPKQEPKKEEPKPEPKKEEPKPEAEKIKDDTKKPEPKKEEKPKPKPPEKPKPKPKPKDTDLDSLLKTLEKSSEGKEEKSKKQARSEQTDAEHEAKGQFDENKPLSISEHNAIKQQIERNWNKPPGSTDAAGALITLRISLKSDGAVEKVVESSRQCSAIGSILCDAIVESAKRAVWKASPLQNLSVERYDVWGELELPFAPNEM